MALVCACQIALSGRARIGNSEDVLSSAHVGFHRFLVRWPISDALGPSNSTLVLTKRSTWSHSSRVSVATRHTEGPYRHRRLRASDSDLSNFEKIGNGAIGTVSLSHEEGLANNVDADADGKRPSSAANGSKINKTKKYNSSSKRAPSRRGKSAPPASNKRELSELSEVPGVGSRSNSQGDFQEENDDKCKRDPNGFLLWGSGSKSESVTQMSSLQDGQEMKVQSLRCIVNMDQSGLKESLLDVKIGEQASELEAVWLNLQGVTPRTLPILRQNNAFMGFFQNMINFQLNTLLMMAVHGKLAWIRLQQLFARRMRALEKDSDEELNQREAELQAFSDELMNQSAISEAAYSRSQEALSAAEGTVFNLNSHVDQLKENMTSRDTLLRQFQKEAILSSRGLVRATKSLADAEGRIRDLERQIQTQEEILHEEREKVTAAVREAGFSETAVRTAGDKIAEPTAEIPPLKQLASAGRRAELLSARVNALEQELKSRDSLLSEIKEESNRSAEALKLAAQIKQDLNATRQREDQLTQALDTANGIIKELQAELVENLSSFRAEQALRQMEKMLRDAKAEIEFLRKGVEERDKAIYAMRDEVDRNIGLLSSAAREREDLYTMKLQMEELRVELGFKDTKLTIMREELASVINLARQKQSGLSKHAPSAHAGPSTLLESKPRRKRQSRKQSDTSKSP